MSEINDIDELTEGIFTVNLKSIDQYQRKYPRLMDKYKMGAYDTGSFLGGSNIYLNLIMCKGNIVIPLILQSYVLHWYHMYILHPGMDRTEAMILQRLYWTIIRDIFHK